MRSILLIGECILLGGELADVGQSRMFEALKTLGIIWTAMILIYGSIAIFLIAARWSFRMCKRALRKSN